MNNGHRSAARRLGLVLLWLAFMVGAPPQGYGQGSISGTARESGAGQGIPGVTVAVRGTTLAARSGNNGSYQISGVPAGTHILLFTKEGYQRSSVTNVKVVSGQTTPASATLNPEYYTMETYEVIADPFGDQSAELLFERQLDIGLVDAIGSEFFERAGASDAAEILTKVTGASVVGGKYVVIRGLGDRYGGTTLNGMIVPSSDPDKKTVQMDIFPSGVIDSVVTSKTFTPDVTGSFTGGLVDVRTKAFPEESFIKVSMGTSFNGNANLRDDFLTYDGGGTGPFGDGFGAREVPAEWKGDGPDILGLENTIRRGSDAQKQAAMDEVQRLATQFPSAMGTSRGSSGLNQKYSIIGGGNTELFGKRLGVLGGFNYARTYSFADDAQQNRFNASAPTQSLDSRQLYDEVQGSQNLGYSAVANLGYELNDNHTLSFVALHVRDLQDSAVFRVGENQQERSLRSERHVLQFTDRALNTLQFESEKIFPELNDAKNEFKVSYSETKQSQPDLRFLEYGVNPDSGNISILPSFMLEPSRIFRSIEESNVNVLVHNTIPFTWWRDLENQIKFGFAFEDSVRDFTEERFTYNSGNNYGVLNTSDPVDLGAPENFFLTADRFGSTRPTLTLRKNAQSFYRGEQTVWGGYLMGDFRVWDRWRLIPGVRYETTLIGIAANNRSIVSESELNEANLLPAASLVYEMSDDMNLRFAFGKTIARPTFKEIAAVTIEDFTNNLLFTGNPDLQLTEATNLDLRWEWFPQPGYILADRDDTFHLCVNQPLGRVHPIILQTRFSATMPSC